MTELRQLLAARAGIADIAMVGGLLARPGNYGGYAVTKAIKRPQ